jgi:hypothetical protein
MKTSNLFHEKSGTFKLNECALVLKSVKKLLQFNSYLGEHMNHFFTFEY